MANSHGAEVAARLRLPLMRAGFPIYDRAGAHLRQWIGYRGSRETVFELSNLLTGAERQIAPYRSIFWAGTPREDEQSFAGPAVGQTGRARA